MIATRLKRRPVVVDVYIKHQQSNQQISANRFIKLQFVTAHYFLLDYLCDRQANVYGIEFTRFKIRDMDGGKTLFEIAKPDDFQLDEGDEEDEAIGDEVQQDDPNAGRFVRYKFTPDFLKLHTVGAT